MQIPPVYRKDPIMPATPEPYVPSYRALRQTPGGIYYLHDYIPMHRVAGYSYEDYKQSVDIIAYKDCSAKAVYIFSLEFCLALVALAGRIPQTQLWLFAVPPSKVHKFSPVRMSITNICGLYTTGIIASALGCQKAFLNYSHALERTRDITTSHHGKRDAYDVQMSSLSLCMPDSSPLPVDSQTPEFLQNATTFSGSVFSPDTASNPGTSQKNAFPSDAALIILDDLTTTGTSMDVCRDLLINSGASPENIYRMVLARTLWF